MTYMNRYFLFKAFHSVLDLCYRNIQLIKFFLCGVRRGTTVKNYENIILIFSFANSLIFAEIFSDIFNMFGAPGRFVGFSMGILVYFSSRFCSSIEFFNNILSKEWRSQEDSLHYALMCKSNSPRLMLAKNRASRVSFAADDLDPIKVKLYKKVIPLIGCFISALLIIPLFSTLVPASVRGAETLTGISIGASSSYQNGGTFIFGIFATSLSMIFYSLNLYKLPQRLTTSTFDAINSLKMNDRPSAYRIMSFTIFAAATSFLTSLGFKLVADTNVALGYNSYLGKIQSAMPASIVLALGLSFWSVLQNIVIESETKRLNAAEQRHIFSGFFREEEKNASLSAPFLPAFNVEDEDPQHSRGQQHSMTLTEYH